MDKRINVKITASASGFDKAIKKAQKSINKLNDSVDDMGKSKAGKNIAKQFDSITKASKKTDKQLDSTEKSLKAITKTKLNKLEKQFVGIEKSSKKLDKQLEGNEKTLKSLAKTKLNNLVKQIENTEKSSKQLDKQIESTEKTVKTLNKIKLNNLSKQLDNIGEAAEDTGEAVEDAADSFRQLERVDIDDIGDNLKDIAKQINKVEDSVDDLSNAFKDLDNASDRIDTDVFNDLNSDINKLENNVSSLSDDFEGLKDDISDIGNDNSFIDLNRDIDRFETNLNDVLDTISNLRNDINRIDAGNAFNDLNGDVDRLETNVNNLSDEFSDLRSYINRIDSGNTFEDLSQDVSNTDKKINALSSEIKELGNNLEKVDNNDFNNLQKDITNLTESTEKTTESFKKMGQSIQDIVTGKLKSLSNIDIKFNGSKSESGLSDEIIGSLITSSAIKNALTPIQSITKELAEQNEELSKQLNNYNNIQDEIKNNEKAITKLSRKQADLNEELNKVDENDNSEETLKRRADLINKIEKAQAKLNKQLEKASKLQIVNDESKQNIKSTIEQINELARQMRNLGQDVKSINIDKVFAALDKGPLSSNQIKNITSNVDELLSPLEKLKRIYGQLQSELEDVSKKLEKAQSAIGKQKNNYQASADAIELYKQSLETTTVHAKKLQDAIDTSNVILSHTKNYTDENVAALKKLIDQHDKLVKQKQMLIDAIKKEENAQSMAESAMARTSARISEQINKQNKLKQTLEKLQQEIDRVSQEMDEVGSTPDPFKNFKDALEELKVHLKDALDAFNKGDFSGAFNSLINAGKTVFMKAIPMWAKAAAALIIVLNKLYQAGSKRFFEGLADIKNTFQPVMNLIKSGAQEIKAAFETLTGTNLDFSSAILTGVEFESQMAKVGAIAGATDEELEQLIATAREWGATTRYSATEAAQAMEYMGMAGWSVQEIMSGMGGVLNLATVASMDLGQASDFVTDALTALGMHASQASDMVDMLAATSTKSNTSVAQMQSAFTNVAPIAGTLGVTMSDLSVALGLMANQGVKAEKAGTALKNLLTNMSAPTEAMTKCIEKYNLETAQTLIKNGQLVDGIIEMQKQLEGLEAAEKAAVITTIAGKEALSGVAAIMNSSYNDIMNLKFAVDSGTKAGKMFAQSLGLIDEEGRVLIEDFNNMTDAQKEAYKQWENFNSVLNETVDTMTLVGGSTADLGAIIQKLGEDGEVTADQVNGVLDFFEKVKTKSKESSDALKEYGIEVQYAEDGSVDFGETLKNVGKSWDELSDSEKQALAEMLGFKGEVSQLDELFSDSGETIEELVDAYENCESVAEHMAKTFDATLKGSVLNLASAIEEQLLQIFDKVKPAVQSVIDTITEFFNIWNGMSDANEGIKGFGNAIKWLEEQSKGWGTAIKEGVTNAISGISDFVNGGSFDSILNIGTNIITGICDGIIKSKDNLNKAIEGIIGKICDWINTNGPKLEQAAKTIIDAIKNGIAKNSDKINSACDTIYNIINTYLNGKRSIIGELGVILGASMIEGFLKGITMGAVDIAGQGIAFIVTTIGQLAADLVNAGKELGMAILDGIAQAIGKAEEWASIKQSIGNWWNEIVENDNGPTSKYEDSQGKTNKTHESFAGEIESARAAGNKTAEEYKKGVQEKLNDGELSKNAADAINRALDRGEEAKKGAWKVTKGYISELQSRLASGSIDESTFNRLLESLTIIDKAKGKAEEGAREYYDSLETALMNGQIDPSAVDTILAGLSASEAIYNNASDAGKNYIDALRQQLVSGQITPEEFNALIFSGSLEEAAQKYAETGKITADDVIDASSFSNVQEVNDLMAALDDLNAKYAELSGSITDACTGMADATRTSFVGIANIARNQFVNVANIIRNQMVNCTNIVRNQALNMSNIFRNQFLSMANVARNQMLNVSNIVRNQAVSWSNIIRNQVQNARNALTSSFISMRNVARTQMVGISNIIRNQAVNWSNIIRNQAQNARNALTSSFMSMHAVVRNQMSNCLSTVRSYMSQIAAACSRSLRINVNVNKTTTNTTVNKTVNVPGTGTMSLAGAYGAISSAGAMALSSGVSAYNTQALTHAASSISLGELAAGATNVHQKDNIKLEIPVTLDGREVARATATYMNGELKKMETRSNRRRGE